LDLAKIQGPIKQLCKAWTKSEEGEVTYSTTFGDDSPMSLGWALDIAMRAEDKEVRKRIVLRLLKRCKRRIADFLEAAKKVTQRPSRARNLAECIMSPPADDHVGDSAYILMRFAQLIRAAATIQENDAGMAAKLGPEFRGDLAKVQDVMLRLFGGRIHEQLS